MKGTITRRGKSSWRIKFDVGRDPVTSARQIRYQTVRGKRQDAERELAKALTSHHEGTFVEPSKITVGEYLRSWLDRAEVTPKTLERYRQLAEQQIIPRLGNTLLQKLRPVHIEEWHAVLLREGGTTGKPLSPRTVGHAHRVLHRALARAVAAEVIARNVAGSISPPRVDAGEIEILDAEQMASILPKLEGHPLFTIAALALGSGMRRGEIVGLQWGDIDLDAAVLRVERAVEETKAGLRVKPPKTRHGRRTISLPAQTIDALRSHRKAQLEVRIALGLGRQEPGSWVFCSLNGDLLSPDNLSRDWRRAVKARALPPVSFHALRHSHASALIAGGMDVVAVSRRLGHGSPNVTLTTYAHLFKRADHSAASAIEAALRG